MSIEAAADTFVPTPRRSAVMHGWVSAEVMEVYERRAAELGMHVDVLVARILTAGALDYERSRLKREK